MLISSMLLYTVAKAQKPRSRASLTVTVILSPVWAITQDANTCIFVAAALGYGTSQGKFGFDGYVSE